MSTHNAAAQAAFERGLLDYYGYNPAAAEHEFYSAADDDPYFAMAYRGIAMANMQNPCRRSRARMHAMPPAPMRP